MEAVERRGLVIEGLTKNGADRGFGKWAPGAGRGFAGRQGVVVQGIVVVAQGQNPVRMMGRPVVQAGTANSARASTRVSSSASVLK